QRGPRRRRRGGPSSGRRRAVGDDGRAGHRPARRGHRRRPARLPRILRGGGGDPLRVRGAGAVGSRRSRWRRPRPGAGGGGALARSPHRLADRARRLGTGLLPDGRAAADPAAPRRPARADARDRRPPDLCLRCRGGPRLPAGHTAGRRDPRPATDPRSAGAVLALRGRAGRGALGVAVRDPALPAGAVRGSGVSHRRRTRGSVRRRRRDRRHQLRADRCGVPRARHRHQRAGVVVADRRLRLPRPDRAGVRAARAAAAVDGARRPYRVSRPLVDIRLEALSTRGGAPPGLAEVSVHVRYGEFFTFLGPPHSGKTDVLRAVAGFMPVSGGRVLVDGHDVAARPPGTRSIGYVFQEGALWPHLPVREHVAFGLTARGMAAAEVQRRIATVLARLGLEDVADRRPTALSPEQRRRLALARALAPEPHVLLLDEPLAHLDPIARKTLRIELAKLQRDLAVTTIHVTRDAA